MSNIDIYLTDDEKFSDLFPEDIRKLAQRHWTSFDIIDLAVEFLAEDGAKILDIGSGVGKFCLAGAFYAPKVSFYGVEQRPNLFELAKNAQEKLGIRNATFIKGNFTQLKLQEFTHFYFFNSFFENLEGADHIDESVELSPSLFKYYNRYLFNELQKMPSGTKVVTYHSILEEIPRTYELVNSLEGADLNFWIKR